MLRRISPIEEQKSIVAILISTFGFLMELREALVKLVNLKKKIANLLLSGELSKQEVAN
jgi:hypothetical protein